MLNLRGEYDCTVDAKGRIRLPSGLLKKLGERETYDFVLNTNKQAFQDVFQNLVSNSIIALRNTKSKKIKCSGYLDAENFTIYFYWCIIHLLLF